MTNAIVIWDEVGILGKEGSIEILFEIFETKILSTRFCRVFVMRVEFDFDHHWIKRIRCGISLFPTLFHPLKKRKKEQKGGEGAGRQEAACA